MAFPSVGAIGAGEVETHQSVVRHVIAHAESKSVFEGDVLTAIDGADVGCRLVDGDILTVAAQGGGDIAGVDGSHVLKKNLIKTS